ncbi:dihydropteroate synthase [Nocardia sp. R16R-3T]
MMIETRRIPDDFSEPATLENDMRSSEPTSATLVGIVNVTPDSFSDGGRFFGADTAIEHGLRLHRDGADIVDVGGESTRPGAVPVSPEEEQRRVLPVVAGLAARGVTVSIDTMNSSTARRAVELGAAVVNDVSGGLHDPAMLSALAALDCRVVLGHLRGNPATMQSHARYDDPAAEVAIELMDRVQCAQDAGVRRDRLIVDPGIGFAKLPEHNWAVLRELGSLETIGCPVMVGVSRKRFLAEIVPGDPRSGERDLATALLSAQLAASGAAFLRVHNVQLTRLALRTSQLAKQRLGSDHFVHNDGDWQHCTTAVAGVRWIVRD